MHSTILNQIEEMVGYLSRKEQLCSLRSPTPGASSAPSLSLRLHGLTELRQLVDWVLQFGKWILEIVNRPKDQKGFVVLPRRWVVERTFAWLGRYRRLSKDYERLCDTSESMIQIAMIHLMLKRLSA